MKTENKNVAVLSDAIGNTDEKQLAEAIAIDSAAKLKSAVGKKRFPVYMKALTGAAACACVALIGMTAWKLAKPTNMTPTNNGNTDVIAVSKHIPNPAMVQVFNPLITVESVEEMETMLDYSVPTLDKDVHAYIVIAADGYARSGRVMYTDGSVYNIRYDTGDISGIYGGKETGKKTIGNVTVTCLQYENIAYAIWEEAGFTFSYSSEGMLDDAELTALIKNFENS